MKEYRFRNNKIFFLTLGLIIVSSIGCATVLAPKNNLTSGSVLPRGTKVEDLDLSGVNYTASEKLIEKWQQSKLAQKIILDYNKVEIPVSLQDLGAEIDKAKILADIKNNPGQIIKATVRIDNVKANQTLKVKLAQFEQPAIDATYKIENNKFLMTDSIPARIPSNDKIIKQIEGKNLNQMPKRIEVTLMNDQAQSGIKTVKDLAFDGVIGEFSTNFSVEEENRTVNLALASTALDKKEIKPGDIFSFNGTVGERTLDKGYKIAKIIKDDRYVEDIGGGVCQVSSTLYNAVILANLQILERVPHEVPVTYVPLGQDATVYYPTVDLKFKNNTGSLIYIRTNVQSGVLTVQLYGKKTDKTVQFKHQIQKVIKGRAGAKGYVVKTWKIVKDSQGREIETFLNLDVYKPAS
ncbi:putative vancomycin resistance protein [Candidatus Desulfosporosinus infrequens]|uniref:Putative vancomycin resistance protein n=1 Tax=Candidatus Desulfosporosinus infrequens TaxID=2043169 RepID=A0A2U3L3Q2_9FIRM|nr:putative vancomycin resistance protein [Candidatus Desulfosporosinus infrequens]